MASTGTLRSPDHFSKEDEMVMRTADQPLETKVREETAEFVRRIGRLSDEPAVRSTLLSRAVHEIAAHLLVEFGDHYALAQQLEIASRLAWCGPDAVHAAARGKPTTANRDARARPGSP
jgi:hypothetical protein